MLAVAAASARFAPSITPFPHSGPAYIQMHALGPTPVAGSTIHVPSCSCCGCGGGYACPSCSPGLPGPPGL
eukprot:766895-Hanusia_phi.AAC.2